MYFVITSKPASKDDYNYRVRGIIAGVKRKYFGGVTRREEERTK
jgi:hypothetical protein